MTISLTTPCTVCGAPAPRNESIEVDPLCRTCARNIAEANDALRATYRADATACPGYGADDCGGPTMPASDLCPDCHAARCDIESPRIPR